MLGNFVFYSYHFFLPSIHASFLIMILHTRQTLVHQLQYHLSYVDLHLMHLGKVKSLQCLQHTEIHVLWGTGIWFLLSTAISQLPETLPVIALAFARVTCATDTESSHANLEQVAWKKWNAKWPLVDAGKFPLFPMLFE